MRDKLIKRQEGARERLKFLSVDLNEKRDKLGVKMFDHAYFSREASRGGGRVGGGGCGCN